MKKNRTLRVSALLLALTLITTCFVGGTFAKYTTSASDDVTARVAKWGFKTTTITLDNLFSNTYAKTDSHYAEGANTVESTVNVVAPGTAGEVTFDFAYDTTNNGATAPEVAYNFAISTDGSSLDIGALDAELKWSLDDENYDLDWADLLAEIKALSGDNSGSKNYAPGKLPDNFNNDSNEHTIRWQWVFEDTNGTVKDNNAADTALGNADTLQNVTLKIAITATQVD